MILKFFLINSLVFLINASCVSAVDLEVLSDTSSSVVVTSTLPKNRYQEVIDSLYPKKMMKLQTFEPSENAVRELSVFLELKSVKELDESRRISLRLNCFSSDFPETEKCLKKRRFEQQVPSFITVGKMLLIENLNPPTDQGSIHLNLLYVFDQFQGKGIGGKALGELKKLTCKLAEESSFYQTITLLSQETDYKGKPLAKVPRRVKFYMDNGFTLDEKTKNLIQFLDINHFIKHLDKEQLAEYMKEYILPKKAKDLAKKVAEYILPVLKKVDKFPVTPFNQLVQMVQTDGTCCAQHILDRTFYWGKEITDEEQNTFNQYVYLMRYSLKPNESEATIFEKSETEINNKLVINALKETIKWNNKPLLPDQNELNDTIYQLMLTSEIYPKQLDGEQIVKKIREYLKN